MSVVFPPFHVGVVVSDLEEAKGCLASAFGLTWHEQLPSSSFQSCSAGLVPSAGQVVYSREGPPYVELIQQVPGTVWAECGLHHLGAWVDDVAAESERLVSLGFPLESAGADSTGKRTGGYYHQIVDGLRVELVDIVLLGSRLTRYLGTSAADSNGST